MFGVSETPYDLRFRFLDIPVRVHPLFWLGSALLAGSSSNDLPLIVTWVACVFVSILVHEYGHGLTAKAFHSSPSIVLWMGGGLCSSEVDRQTPMQRLAVVLWGPGAQHDWELELAIVIGRHAHRVSREDAMDHVAGYTISNDVSTRDLMFRPNFSMTDFLMSKGRPGFFPTGPYIVPREFVEDYRQLRLTLRVNGEAMQDELVDDIIYGVEDLVAYASTVTELRPGDILLTGSPGGNAGHHDNRWLRPGDVMEAEITGLGIMRNRCVAEPGDDATDMAAAAVKPEPIA